MSDKFRKIATAVALVGLSLGGGPARAASPYTTTGGRLACQALGGTTSNGSCARPGSGTEYCAFILQLAGYQGPKDDLFVCNAVKFGWRYG